MTHYSSNPKHAHFSSRGGYPLSPPPSYSGYPPPATRTPQPHYTPPYDQAAHQPPHQPRFYQHQQLPQAPPPPAVKSYQQPPSPPQFQYQLQQQQTYHLPQQGYGYPSKSQKSDHTSHRNGGYGGREVVVVKDTRRTKDDVALGFCAGCVAAVCCCGCTVM